MADRNEPAGSKLQTVRVFFAWQSDLDSSTHRNAIRRALRDAKSRIERKCPSIRIKLDEALRESTGSPNISLDVQGRLQRADIVVADVTTVTRHKAKRPCPNPNVTFELGLGAETVGWNRIIMLFNTATIDPTNKLPFDFAQNRLSTYSMDRDANPDQRKRLGDLVHAALRAIVEQAPLKPSQERGKTSAQIKRERDVRTLRWVMEHLHVPTVDRVIVNLPLHIFDRDFWFHEHLNGAVLSATFHLYDRKMEKALRNLQRQWSRAFSEGEAYTDMIGGGGHIFSRAISGGYGSTGQDRWDRIEAARHEMHTALTKIVKHVRKRYVEIDIDDTNRTAWNTYMAETASAEETG